MARWHGEARVPVAPQSRRAVRPSYGPRCGGPIAVVGPNERLFFLLGGGGGGASARPVARRVLCAAPDAALRVPCVVPDAFLHAPLAVPDAARYQTSPYLRAASSARWASWWLGLQPRSPSKAQTKRPVQIQPRIQGKRARCDDRPVSAPNVHSFSGSRFATPSEHVTNVGGLLIDLDQLGRVVQATLGFRSMGSTLSASEG